MSKLSITLLGTLLAMGAAGWGYKYGNTDILQQPTLPVITVCPQGPPTCRFNKLQAAIDAAPEGATITIKSGTCEENLLIRKSLVLQAAEGEQVVVKSATESLPTLLLVSGRPIQVSVIGLTLLPARQHQGNGIEIMGTVAARIERNVIQDYHFGIFILGKPGWHQLQNLVASISKNTILHNRIGIVIEHSDTVTVATNTVQNELSSQEDAAGVAISNSKKVRILNNSISAGGLYGIAIEQSREIEITDNSIKGNPFAGILVSGSQIIDLLDNKVERNGLLGIAIGALGPLESKTSVRGNRITGQEGYGLGVEWLDYVTTCWKNHLRENQQGNYLVQYPLITFFSQPNRDLAAEEKLRKQCEGG